MAGASYGERQLLRFEGRAISFREADNSTARVSDWLFDAGIKQGDRIGIMLPNGLEFPLIWLGILRFGAIAVPINVQYRKDDIAHLLHDADVRLVIVDASTRKLVEGSSATDMRFASAEVVMRGATSGHHVGGDPAGDQLANLQYTSGTTGLPKACMLTHEYWIGVGYSVGSHLGIDSRDVVLTAQAFSYMDPQWNVVMCLLSGATLVIMAKFSASQFWPVVRAEGITLFYVIGAMPVLLLKQPQSDRDRENRVRIILCSGIEPAMHRELEERWGAPWRECYGMTETGADLAVSIDDVASVGSGNVGHPLPGKQARIVDDAGDIVPHGTVGELVISGAPMMLGYWKRPDATRAMLQADGAHTGDLVYADERGGIHIVGRKKDMIRRGGENISCAEVEGVLRVHPKVRNAAVLAAPDPIFREEVRAVVQPLELNPGKYAELADELGIFVSERLARFKCPRYFTFLTDLPMTESNRVIKRDIPSMEQSSTVTFELRANGQE
jgi:acyl-CoA synthetase (AMP-forming)/AMP-acid ligase II